MSKATRTTSDDSAATNRRRVLELQNVTFGARTETSLCLRDTSFELRAAEMMTIRTHPSQSTRRFASMLQGLVAPDRGVVLFGGRDWAKQHMQTQFRMRAKTGRVFENQGWIANLNVRENLLLAKQHHAANLEEIESQLGFWCDWFKLGKITRMRSSSVESSQLKIYQWIRAFLGPPTLLILERPMRAVSSKLLEGFLGSITHIRSLGTAIIWIDGDTIKQSQGVLPPDITLDLRPGTYADSTALSPEDASPRSVDDDDEDDADNGGPS